MVIEPTQIAISEVTSPINLIEWLKYKGAIRNRGHFIKFAREHWQDDDIRNSLPQLKSSPPGLQSLYSGLTKPPKGYFLHLFNLLQKYEADDKREGKATSLLQEFAVNSDNIMSSFPAASGKGKQHGESASIIQVQPGATVSAFVYHVKSEQFSPRKYTTGYFFLENSFGKMKVESAEAWYRDKDELVRRGAWTSKFVGTSQNDILIVYDFDFDQSHHQGQKSYSGLLVGEIRARTGTQPVCGEGPCYEGAFYVLDGSLQKKASKDGTAYIELIETMPLTKFQSEDCTSRLREKMTEHAPSMMERLDRI